MTKGAGMTDAFLIPMIEALLVTHNIVVTKHALDDNIAMLPVGFYPIIGAGEIMKIVTSIHLLPPKSCT
jgi:hypothetical protein